jgi:hypothetical protein
MLMGLPVMTREMIAAVRLEMLNDLDTWFADVHDAAEGGQEPPMPPPWIWWPAGDAGITVKEVAELIDNPLGFAWRFRELEEQIMNASQGQIRSYQGARDAYFHWE